MRFDAHAHRFILLMDTLAAAGFLSLHPRPVLALLVLGEKSCARVPDK